jgi:hypothetical protein
MSNGWYRAKEHLDRLTCMAYAGGFELNKTLARGKLLLLGDGLVLLDLDFFALGRDDRGCLNLRNVRHTVYVAVKRSH